ncbi:hypothetical protein Tcan_14416 [Toxocara canis]|nr:hypothetical protein Tcan_14416 [Toxocara canis]
MLLALFLAVTTLLSITDNAQGLRWEMYPYHQLHKQQRLLPSAFETLEPAIKRERLSGYGWEQCEFSPMSCLLRRRRRAINAEQKSVDA